MNEGIEIKTALRDPKKFEVLYNRYYENIFRFCYQRSRDYDLAGDLTSQVFVKAMKKLNQYKDKKKGFSSWLISIAFNEVNDFYRKSQKDRTVRIDVSHLSFIHLNDEADKEDLRIELGHALNRLQESDLQLIEMKYFEKRSHDEICQILNISEGNARIRLHRALYKLKRIMQNSLKEKRS